MPDSNKHKIFSKEELFKLIDEKKSLPPEADDFDKEAMEGLSMLADRKKINGLNNSIDEILRLEKAKVKKKRILYILSAAASLILIISFFFLIKDNAIDKQDNIVAENNNLTNDAPKFSEPASSPKNSLEEKTADSKTNGPTTISTGETKGKEEKMLEQEIITESKQKDAAGDVTTVAPAEVAANIESRIEKLKSVSTGADLDNYTKSAGGKDYKKTEAQPDPQLKWQEEAKKADVKLEDKEKEKDKTRYLTNTVWTSTPASGATAVDESKNKNADDRSQIKQDQGGEGTVVSSNETAPQKEAEQFTAEKQIYRAVDKKSKANKKQTAKPDTIVTDMLAGYSYYEKKPERDSREDGDLQKAQQTNQPQAPAQTQHADANRKLTPEFINDETGVQEYVRKNLKISNPKYTGTIDVEFLVKKDGTIDTTSIKIIKQIKGCEVCSKDVIQLIRGMPKWKAAKVTGKETESMEILSVPYISSPSKK